MSGSGGDRFAALAASYALGALDAGELRAFEEHLRDCEECSAEVEAFRAVAGLIAYGVPAVEPPAGLRGAILARAGDESAAPQGAADAHGGRHEPVSSRFPGWLVPATALLATASLLLAAVATIGYLGERDARLQGERALAEVIDELAERDALLGALLSETVSAAHLTSTESAPSIRLFWNSGRNVVVVAAFNLPPAATDRTYQLWGIPEGQAPVSLGTFNTAADGRATVVIPVPQGVDVRESDLSAVTDEPAGGSQQPTTTPFLVGSWEHAQ